MNYQYFTRDIEKPKQTQENLRMTTQRLLETKTAKLQDIKSMDKISLHSYIRDGIKRYGECFILFFYFF